MTLNKQPLADFHILRELCQRVDQRSYFCTGILDRITAEAHKHLKNVQISQQVLRRVIYAN